MLQKKMRSTVQTLSSEAPGEEVDSYRGWEQQEILDVDNDWLLAIGSIMKHHEISRSLHTRASSISIIVISCRSTFIVSSCPTGPNGPT